MADRYGFSKEYKARSDYRYKEVRCNRKLCGEIREYKREGKVIARIYIAMRLPGEFDSRHAAWSFDRALLDRIREEGIPLTHFAILVSSDTKRRARLGDAVEERHIIARQDFFDNLMCEEGEGRALTKWERQRGVSRLLIKQSLFRRMLVGDEDERLERKRKEMLVRK